VVGLEVTHFGWVEITKAGRLGKAGKEQSQSNDRRNHYPHKKLSRGDSLFPFVNEIMGMRIALKFLPQLVEFKADAVLRHVKPNLYSKRQSCCF
jgi:hypothetical protein